MEKKKKIKINEEKIEEIINKEQNKLYVFKITVKKDWKTYKRNESYKLTAEELASVWQYTLEKKKPSNPCKVC